MISYLQGKIIIKREKFIVLDVNSVGYKIFLSRKTISQLPEIGQPCKFFCYLDVGENKMNLYGFLDEKDQEFFEILNDIRGIGPKAAIELSSLGPLERIKDRILSHDESLFRIPGIGQKKAMAIILELSGKIKDIPVSVGKKSAEFNQEEEALVSLGFSHSAAKDALANVPQEITDGSSKIKAALKILGR